jgi:ATP-dependent Clp protease protease subunit
MPWEETENYIRSGHKEPGETCRTITISEKDGIKAIYCKYGEDWAIQSYLFSKGEGWTMERAKEWFNKNHEGIVFALKNRSIELFIKSPENLSLGDFIEFKLMEGRQIIFHGEVMEWTCKEASKRLEYLAQESKEPIKIILNSVGGDVFDGLLLFDTIRNLVKKGIPVLCEARGLAASMGCILVQAGSQRQATENTRFLIHEVSSVAWGKTSEVVEQAEEIKKVNDMLKEILSERTGKSVEEIEKIWHKTDVWFSAKEALDFGLIDQITEEPKKSHLFLNGNITLDEALPNKKFKVHGIAIHPITTIHPGEAFSKRVYILERLQKAAPSLVGRQFMIDHAESLADTKVTLCRWNEKENGLYYEGEVPEAVANNIRNGVFKGVSISVNPWIKGGGVEWVDGVAPFGFEYDELSLIKNMTPADQKAWVQLMEAWEKQFEIDPKHDSKKRDTIRIIWPIKEGWITRDGQHIYIEDEFKGVSDDELNDRLLKAEYGSEEHRKIGDEIKRREAANGEEPGKSKAVPTTTKNEYSSRRLKASFKQDKDEEDRSTITFSSNEKEVGTAEIRDMGKDDQDRKTLYVEHIEVGEKQRGQGFGREQVNILDQYAKDRNFDVIGIDAERPAVGFWKKLGFKTEKDPETGEPVESDLGLVMIRKVKK